MFGLWISDMKALSYQFIAILFKKCIGYIVRKVISVTCNYVKYTTYIYIYMTLLGKPVVAY